MVNTPSPPDAIQPATPPVYTDTERKILDAARQEFVRKGSAGARMQAIADAAGVNKALVHYYFRSKEKLHQAVLSDLFSHMWESLRASATAFEQHTDVRQMVGAVVATLVGVMRDNPDFSLVLTREVSEGGKSFSPIIGQLIRVYGDVPTRIFATLGQGIAAGKLRSNLDPLHIFMSIMGMVLATFIVRPFISTVSTMLRNEPIVYDRVFFEKRIDIITTIVCDGIFADSNKEPSEQGNG